MKWNEIDEMKQLIWIFLLNSIENGRLVDIIIIERGKRRTLFAQSAWAQPKSTNIRSLALSVVNWIVDGHFSASWRQKEKKNCNY